MKRKFVSVLAGFVYGVGLIICGFLLTGAGHGTSLLLVIATSPLSLFNGLLSLVLAPLVWGGDGFFVANGNRKVVAVLLGVHYASLSLMPIWHSADEQGYLAKLYAFSPSAIILGIGFYLLGQLCIWIGWFKFGRSTSLP